MIEISNSKNHKLGQLSCFQKVWKILLLTICSKKVYGMTFWLWAKFGNCTTQIILRGCTQRHDKIALRLQSEELKKIYEYEHHCGKSINKLRAEIVNGIWDCSKQAGLGYLKSISPAKIKGQETFENNFNELFITISWNLFF